MKKFVDVLVEETLPVGTIVRIKNDLITDKTYDGIDFVKDMEQYKGCIRDIKTIDEDLNIYTLSCTKPFGFTNSMLQREVEIEEPTLDDLKTGMLVELSHGNIFMVFKGTYKNDFISCRTTKHSLKYYNNDLTNKSDNLLDIVKIYEHPYVEVGIQSFIENGIKSGYKLSWERKSTKIKKAEEEVNIAKEMLEKAKKNLEEAENKLKNLCNNKRV